MAGTPNVRLRLAGRAENVLLIRQALNGVADAIGLDAVSLNDISTAVTEAANNVVAHAYGGAEGPLEFELSATAQGIDVIVRDRGRGILPGAKASEDLVGGIGLPVIEALSESMELRDVPGGGTEVAMHFDAVGSRALEQASAEEGTELEAVEGDGTAGEVTVMSVGPTSIARGVVPRVLSTLAARAYFSTDGISDTQLLADALVEHTGGSIAASNLNVGVSVLPRNLQVRIGPLRAGRAGAVFGEAALAGLGPVLERLTDGHTVSVTGSSEMLDVRLAQRG
jgi:serine/threonine-protein kinase RsbW